MPTTPCDLEESVHGKVKELTPHNKPVALEKHVVTISYHDSNLHHDTMTEGSVTGVFHMRNKTPIDWNSKKEEIYY